MDNLPYLLFIILSPLVIFVPLTLISTILYYGLHLQSDLRYGKVLVLVFGVVIVHGVIGQLFGFFGFDPEGVFIKSGYVHVDNRLMIYNIVVNLCQIVYVFVMSKWYLHLRNVRLYGYFIIIVIFLLSFTSISTH